MRARNRKTKVTASLLLTFLLLTTNTPAAIADTTSFGMSKTSVRAGEATELTEIDPCPVPVNPFPFGNYVEVSFTDGLGAVSQWSIPFDEHGHWTRSILMTPPHMRVLSYNPPTYSTNAWPGPGTVQAKCVETGTTTQEYTPQTLTINGPSAGFTVTPGIVKVNNSVHLQSVLPCPAGSASVDGVMYSSVGLNIYSYQGTLDVNGHWSIDFTLPSTFPEGFGLFNAFCRPWGDHQGWRTQAYAETWAKVNPDKFNHVAWGDSYSSGDGVEPFESGTEGAAGCRRSVDAYSRVLERDSALKLRLGSNFVACSGATTALITQGTSALPAQMDTLAADTDLVTITIGGNNMDFNEFARACVLPFQGQTCSGSAYDNAISKISSEVAPDLEYMLGTVRDRLITLGNTDATVLVLGYPYLVPQTWQYYSAGCWWLQSDETPAIRQVTQQLNAAIEDKVDAIGYDFHFVSATDTNSPFVGHELCRNTSDSAPNYFNNVNTSAPEAYTFHPNKAGQEAYATLVKNWLVAHPLN